MFDFLNESLVGGEWFEGESGEGLSLGSMGVTVFTGIITVRVVAVCGVGKLHENELRNYSFEDWKDHIKDCVIQCKYLKITPCTSKSVLTR